MPEWDHLLINARIATMHNGYGIIESGALAVKEGKIAWLGTMESLPNAPRNAATTVIDCKNQWLTPGLIDCHTHLVYAGNRANEFAQRLEGATYAEIAKAGGGILSTVNATRAASEQQLLDASAPRLESMLSRGVTTVEIKSGYGLDFTTERKMLRVAKALGKQYPVNIRCTYLGAHTIPPEYKDNPDDYITQITTHDLPALAAEGLIDAVDAYCEHIAFSLTQVEEIFKAAQALNLPVKLHAEQLSDQQGTQLAARYQALSADHLEYVSEAGVIAMAEADMVATLLPGAYYFLKETKAPPISLLRQHNIPIAIATDCNPGTSPNTNLLLMMNMACTLFGLTAVEALQGITTHAAKALGIKNHHGTLEPNKNAELLLWNISHPDELSYTMGDAKPSQIFRFISC